MEAYKKGDSWDLPENPRERQKRVSEIAADLCDQFDEIFYEFANKAIEDIERQKKAQRDLGNQALKESE